MKGYRPWDPWQPLLFPPSPSDWLPEGHLVYFLLEVVGEFDLSRIEAAIQSKDPRGTQPYHPRMMVGLLLYGYCVGIASSRKLERASQEDVAFRVLCGGNHPDHTVISEFRRRYLEVLEGLFLQVLRLCQEAGLVKLGHVALDGTKVQANASKHKAMSYERMLKSEQELEGEVKRLLKRAEEVDQAEDELHGKGCRGDELPEELRRRQGRLDKIREARARLEAEAARTRAAELRERAEDAREKAEKAEDAEREKAKGRAERARQRASKGAAKAVERADQWVEEARQQVERKERQAQSPAEHRQASEAEERLARARRERDRAGELAAADECASRSPAELPEHRVEADKHGDPAGRAQMNFTDPDSRIMKSGSGFAQAYNCQAVVDEEHQVIVARAVSNQAPDQEHLQPMLQQVVELCGVAPAVFTADAGYWSESNAAFCEELGTEALISTARSKHGSQDPEHSPSPPPNAAPGEAAASAKERMQAKLQSEEGRALYARRKAVVEPAFGQIKGARGFRQFLLRGTERVRAEWSLICAGHNLLKLYRAASACAART